MCDDDFFHDSQEWRAMAPNRPRGTRPALTVVHWGARILSLPVLAFWGWFLLAHLAGDAGPAERPLALSDQAILTSVVLSLAGLVVAWKRELLGGTVTLAAVAIGAILNPRVLAFPGTLVPIVAALFVASGWIAGRPRSTRSA